MEEKKAVIIGSSSGIGRALAFKLSREGYVLGLTGRDPDKLNALQSELPGKSFVRKVDVRDAREAIHTLGNLIMYLHGMDLLVINAGVLSHNPELNWLAEEETVKVNAMGFMAMAVMGVNYFLKQGAGTLVGISSVAGHRGSGRSPAYSASKAFMMNYLEGLRQKCSGTPVKVIDVRPGFIDTDMIRGRKGLFGVVSPEGAADGIFNAVRKGKGVAYVPWWWRPLMWGLDRVPESVYNLGYCKYVDWDKKPPAG